MAQEESYLIKMVREKDAEKERLRAKKAERKRKAREEKRKIKRQNLTDEIAAGYLETNSSEQSSQSLGRLSRGDNGGIVKTGYLGEGNSNPGGGFGSSSNYSGPKLKRF